MSGQIRVKIYYIPEQGQEKYGSERLVYEQTVNEQWLTNTNPDYFQKVILAFNGIPMMEKTNECL